MNFEIDDPSAGIQVSEGVRKIRKLNKKIGDNLKQLYCYRCQICGQSIGEEYDAHVCEAHHIDYFTKGLNNSATNQMIVCPNHHRIIHADNPSFDRSVLQFTFSNGYIEPIRLNYHL